MFFRKLKSEIRARFDKLSERQKRIQRDVKTIRLQQQLFVKEMAEKTDAISKMVESSSGTGQHALWKMPLKEIILEQPTSRVLQYFVANSRSQFIGKDTAVSVILGKHFMFVDTKDLGFGPHIMLNGYWEYWVAQAVTRLLHSDTVFLDVGANFGFYSVLAGAVTENQATIHAIEANPNIERHLNLTFALNGLKGRIHKIAAWNESGVNLSFTIPCDEPKNASVTGCRATEEQSIQATVGASRLDDVFAGQKVDVIKVDVEGAEYQVWQGMRGLFAQNPALIALIEVNQARNPAGADLLREALEMGLVAGYIEYDGTIRPFTMDMLLNTRHGEDYMISLSRRPLHEYDGVAGQV
jgi:FkbM family methyltransferase